ncbi:MAG: hypothetical protein SFX18_08940 [Pirellulales bacterium]|nr:hypothetical protein [Pirellulales bacterium]
MKNNAESHTSNWREMGKRVLNWESWFVVGGNICRHPFVIASDTFASDTFASAAFTNVAFARVIVAWRRDER